MPISFQMKIAICDDDEKDRAAMKTLVAEYLDLHNYHVRIDEYPSGEAFLAANKREYDLTLFTCNYTGKARVTVRCDRVEE